MTSSAPDPDGPDRADAATEAGRLVGALRDAATAWARQAGDHERPVDGDAPGHGPTCTSCPVCLAMRRLQRSRPEVAAHLGEAAASLAAALCALVADERPTPAEAGDRPPSSWWPEPRPDVERIEVAE